VRHRLTEIRASISAGEALVADIERRMSLNEAVAEIVAQELYKGGSTGALEVVLASESFADVETRLQYLRSSEDARARVFERLAVDRQLLDERLRRLERQRAQALEARVRLADLRADIETKVEDQRAEIAHLRELIERAERRREERLAAAAAVQEVEGDASTAEVAAPAAPAPAASSQAGLAVQAALAQVGKPYQWGGAGPDSFDCSGLTMWAWAQGGVSLPHNSGMQYAATARVAQSDLQPGDLLFYGSPIHHVAIYIGGGQIVEAPYSGETVRVASAARSDYVGAGRPGV
jgi:peptidoglycan DL-endopeptidase CwlO